MPQQTHMFPETQYIMMKSKCVVGSIYIPTWIYVLNTYTLTNIYLYA